MSPHTAARLAALRHVLKERDLGGFLVPLVDEHASEYVGDYAGRLAWLTGFTGSAGSAIVLADKAAIFIDGRYTLQVKAQVDAKLFHHAPIAETDMIAWLEAEAPIGARIGYDPQLHFIGWLEKARKALRHRKVTLEAVESNPIDEVWSDQPARPDALAYPHDVSHAGIPSAEKRLDIAASLSSKGADAAIVTALDSIAWLFNIRGSDVAHTPVALSYAILHADSSARLFIAPEKVDDALRAHLGNAIRLEPYDGFYRALADYKGKAVLADPDTANAAIFQQLETAGADIITAPDPCALPKATKNAIEINGAKAAHLRDGAAVAEFLHWVDCHAAKGGVTEMKAVETLFDFRAKRGGLKDTSFDTISGSGPNGAIVHYRVSENTDRELRAGELYLVDSGGQYADGTTDITRTVPIGDVGEEEKERFTLVLKGHIALATLRFPKGTTGAQIDAIARRPLWEAGLDYDHGTGHGVGSFLAVHEGPQRIAKIPNAIALRPGMILSNEPGYYKTGGYGIRIENLIVVAEDQRRSEKPFLHFETITMAPIDRRLIVVAMLNENERRWIDIYHHRVREALTPLVSEECRPWLREMTAPLPRAGEEPSDEL